MPLSLKRITTPDVEPVSLDLAMRARLRLDGSSDDADVEAMIAAARELVESETKRAFITQSWSLFLDSFPCGNEEIRVPRPPLQSVTWIKYYDTDGVLQTLSSGNYHVAVVSEPGRIWPVNGGVWPASQWGRPEAVEVRFLAGFGDSPANCPRAALEAIKVIVANRYMHRGDDEQTSIPPAARRLIDTLEVGEVW